MRVWLDTNCSVTRRGKTNTHLMKWIVLGSALFQGGWFMFDGGRALVIADHVTPTSGPRAGQPGPRARIGSAVGVEPRSTSLKGLPPLPGLGGPLGLDPFVICPRTGWWVVLCCGIARLGYLPMGPFLSIAAVALLLPRQLRSSWWEGFSEHDQ